MPVSCVRQLTNRHHTVQVNRRFEFALCLAAILVVLAGASAFDDLDRTPSMEAPCP